MFKKTQKALLEKNLFWLNKLFFKRNIGVENYQNVYEYLYEIALRGMNFGEGANVSESGEMYVISFIEKEYSDDSQLIIFDGGANVGNYTKSILSHLKKKHFIYCFEPSIITFEELQRELINTDHAELINLGLGSKKETLNLYSNEKKSDIASIYKRQLEHLDIEFSNDEKVNLTTVDEFCFENKINRINFLKLDIEGNEFSALKGAANMIENGKIDFIQFEFGGCNIDSKTYFRDFWHLLNEKYFIYRVLKNGLRKIQSYSVGLEVFQNINYLAKRKSL